MENHICVSMKSDPLDSLAGRKWKIQYHPNSRLLSRSKSDKKKYVYAHVVMCMHLWKDMDVTNEHQRF